MKVNRKPTTGMENFGELLTSTTFLIPTNRTAIFMKLDMSLIDIFCDRCDNAVTVEDEYAVNLITGEVESFDYRTTVIPVNCEVNEI